MDTLTRAARDAAREISTPTDSTPEEWLLASVRAQDPAHRERYAQKGLAFDDIDDDTHVLLLRQLYVAHLEQGRLERALEVTTRMLAVAALPDVVHHDRARVLVGLGRSLEALHAQRLAARTATPKRKSFQLWSLATLEHHRGDTEGALRTLARALRASVRDRALLKAHALFIKLERGDAVRGADEIVHALEASKNREGYGEYLLGMIAHHRGDRARATAHLGAFLTRNRAVDAAKALTLEEELRRATRVMNADP